MPLNKNFKIALLKAIGFSTYGVCPQSFITTRLLCGISLYSFAYCKGIILSLSPHISNVGVSIFDNLPGSVSDSLMPNNVDIKAYFAFGSLILFTKSRTVSSVTLLGSYAISINALRALS